MNKIVEWYQSLSASAKLSVYILGTIVLGCIGSGLWAKLVGPSTDSILNFIIAFCSKYFASHMDSLFNRAAYGDYNSGVSRFLILFSALIYILATFMDSLFGKSDKNKSIIKAIRFPLMIIALLMMFWFTGHSVSDSIAKKAITSLEIVHPYVQEQEYLMLKSEFHSIKSQEDYKVFYDKMKAIEDKNPEITLKLGRID